LSERATFDVCNLFELDAAGLGALVAVLENNQQEDGSVIVPPAPGHFSAWGMLCCCPARSRRITLSRWAWFMSPCMASAA